MTTSRPPFEAEKSSADARQMSIHEHEHPQPPSLHQSSYPMTWALIFVLSGLLFSCLSYFFLLHPSSLHTNNDATFFASGHGRSSRPRLWNHLPRRVEDVSGTTSSTDGSDSVTPSTTTVIVIASPSIGPPPIPTTTPVLPTPFPQPLDTSLNRNFKDQACYDFFLNMTNTLPFRSCRPFSLLLQSSSEFTQVCSLHVLMILKLIPLDGQAQSNSTELNDIIWGTCNPDPGLQQCTENMGWFADNLKSICSSDLSAGNTVATSTLLGAFFFLNFPSCALYTNDF
jgi:hypothetical protein